MNSRHCNEERSRRGGFVAVVVLACLTLLLLIGGLLMRQVSARRQLARLQARRLQTEYLAEAGVQRARARLAADSKYNGEIWTIPAIELGFPAPGGGKSSEGESASFEFDAIVTITLEASKDDPKRREIRVQADYPRDPQLRSRQSRRIAVDVEFQPKAVGGASE